MSRVLKIALCSNSKALAKQAKLTTLLEGLEAHVRAAVERYCKIAGEAGCTPAQLAIAYCKSRWFIPSTIVGATGVEQLEENLDGFSVNLPSAVIAAIDEVHMRNRNPALGD
eukprot:TRINITY_DN8674_c0_g1_i2.p1 TRINITY_DN8674_c0_g1~~TRINITY_DN8674_c0_g1_i2.p1  ORF type:complete len:112 (+),score=20.25 TRINITY_DN8674_c0_g1_i2:96-431(+)